MANTVLIVDDEPLLLSIFRRHLIKQGYAVLTAVNGQEALEIFNTHASLIQTIVLDIHLSGDLSGWDVVEEIHRNDYSPKIVCMSGEPQPLSAPPVDAFLEKPFRVQRLIELIPML